MPVFSKARTYNCQNTARSRNKNAPCFKQSIFCCDLLEGNNFMFIVKVAFVCYLITFGNDIQFNNWKIPRTVTWRESTLNRRQWRCTSGTPKGPQYSFRTEAAIKSWHRGSPILISTDYELKWKVSLEELDLRHFFLVLKVPPNNNGQKTTSVLWYLRTICDNLNYLTSTENINILVHHSDLLHDEYKLPGYCTTEGAILKLVLSILWTFIRPHTSVDYVTSPLHLQLCSSGYKSIHHCSETVSSRSWLSRTFTRTPSRGVLSWILNYTD